MTKYIIFFLLIIINVEFCIKSNCYSSSLSNDDESPPPKLRNIWPIAPQKFDEYEGKRQIVFAPPQYNNNIKKTKFYNIAKKRTYKKNNLRKKRTFDSKNYRKRNIIAKKNQINKKKSKKRINVSKKYKIKNQRRPASNIKKQKRKRK